MADAKQVSVAVASDDAEEQIRVLRRARACIAKTCADAGLFTWTTGRLRASVGSRYLRAGDVHLLRLRVAPRARSGEQFDDETLGLFPSRTSCAPRSGRRRAAVPARGSRPHRGRRRAIVLVYYYIFVESTERAGLALFRRSARRAHPDRPHSPPWRFSTPRSDPRVSRASPGRRSGRSSRFCSSRLR